MSPAQFSTGPNFSGVAADLGNSPLSITETPQLIAGVGCR